MTNDTSRLARSTSLRPFQSSGWICIPCAFENESLSQYPRWNTILLASILNTPHPRKPSGSRHSRITQSPILKQVFDLTDHLRGAEFALEHSMDRCAPFDRFVYDLMVNCILSVKTGNLIGVTTIESLYPRLDDLFRAHTGEYTDGPGDLHQLCAQIVNFRLISINSS